MNSKIKWLGLLLIVALMLTGLTATVLAAPAAPMATDNDLDGLLAPGADPNDSTADTDGDGLCDGAGAAIGCVNLYGVGNPGEDVDGDGVVDAGETSNIKADTDNDGVPDGWEWVFNAAGPGGVPAWLTAKYGGPAAGTLAGCGATDPLDATDALKDIGDDNGQDGLNNLQEFQGVIGWKPTNPCLTDTDADGRVDGDEVDPTVWNVFPKGTDPNNPDTDGDGLCDGVEHNTDLFIPVWVGAHPGAPTGLQTMINPVGAGYLYPATPNCTQQLTDAATFGDAGTDPSDADSDGDGINDGVESVGSSNPWNGTNAPTFTKTGPVGHISDPNKADTDGDTLADKDELDIHGTDPARVDSDGDGMPDPYEVARKNCGFGSLDPTVNDATGDVDGDGLWNITEYDGVDGLNGTADDAKFTDACKVDTDGDGMNDGFEFFYSKAALGNMPGVGPLDPTVDDTALDPDKDAASNYTEYMGVDKKEPLKYAAPDPKAGKFYYPPTGDHTDPSNPDTDGEGFLDGFEYWSRWDPKQTKCTTVNEWMNPRVTVDVWGSDYDGEGLLNGDEWNGKDGKAPTTADITALFPGDLKGAAWNVDDPFYWFQPAGKGKDATNPCNPDTDRGGYTDYIEVVLLPGMDPNWKTDDKTKDHDFDGIPTYTEDASHDGVYQAGETDWYDPDTDKDGLCDGKVQSDGMLNGGAKVQLVGSYGNHKIVVVKGAWYSDFDDNNLYFPTDADDLFICGGGEDLDGNGKIAGDNNNNHGWLPLGANGIWENGAGDDEVLTETDPRHPDTDLDGLCDGSPVGNFGLPNNPPCTGSEDADNSGSKSASETNPLDADTDDDQLSDGLEKSSACLSAVNADTDDDTLVDGFATIQQFVDPASFQGRQGIQLGNGFGFAVWNGYDGADDILGNADDQPGEDVNLSGARNGQETSACSDDTDKDGVKDNIEYTKYEMPLYVGPWNTANQLRNDTNIDAPVDNDRPALDPDSDGDSLCDGDVKNAANTGCNLIGTINQIIGEDLNGDGMSPAPETDPMDPDSDNDSVWDGVEVTWYETFNCTTKKYEDWNAAGFDLTATWDCDGKGDRDALDFDSDEDMLPDGFVDGANGKPADGNIQPGEGEDVDFNGRIAGDDNIAWDRVWQAGEVFTETDPLNVDTDGDGILDGIEVLADWADKCASALTTDADGDGLLDPQEDRNKNGILEGDADKDEFIDAGETWLNTNPCNADTDGDSVEDYVEVWGWEWGNLISSGYPGMVEPKPMPDPDGDGKINAVDVDSDNDGWNDGAEDNGDDGLIGYGGLFTNFPAFRSWAPQGGIPYAWNLPGNPAAAGWLEYARQMDTPPPPPGVWLGLNFGYPVVGGPILPGQPLASGDWDRDRIVDAPYAISDPSTAWAGMMWEDWDETDPLNADTDGDGISDRVEDNAQYAGALQQVAAGFCNGSNMWGPVTADQDGDGLVDGAEDLDLDGIYFEAVPPAINDATTIGGTGTQPVAGPGATKGPESDPCNSDTDGDGVSDGSDVAAGGSPVDTDTDDDTLLDGVEIFGNVPGPYGKQICDPAVADSDGDGLKDGEEGSLGVDSYLTLCKDADTDDGGVSDGDEWFVLVAAGVPGNPLDGADDTADTDGDGINNYDELTDPVNTCLDPKVSDSDGDLLGDGEELSKYGTDPCDEDTDGDLIGDGDEILFTKTDPKDTDSDDDGLTDGEEVFLYKSDPNKKDTDGDGLTDGDEVKVYDTDPNKKDTDGDGMNDKYEVSHACLNPKVKDSGADADSDGLTNLQESKLDTDPCSADTDGDGMMDGDEAKYSCLNPRVADADGDADSDGLTNGEEVAAGSDPCDADTDGDGLNDKADPWPLSTDGDKDGMPDAYEVLHSCLDPKVADADADPDKDGYTNIEEYQKGTDPCVFNCELAYDWDQDNEVTVNDVLMMVPHWQETAASPNWVADYDVDGDGSITVIDFMTVVNAIGNTCKLP